MVDTNLLRSVNLNRLPVLWELLCCRNVSIAAANLNLTQSAVSSTLKSLRELYDDELLTAVGRGFVLTERAQEIVPLLQAALNMLGAVVHEPIFDPATDDGTFRVSTVDYVSILLLPELSKKLQSDAPSTTVQVMPATTKAMQDLRLGMYDLIIAPEQVVDWIGARGHESELQFEKCFVDPYVCIGRPGADTQNMDVDGYLARPHATFRLYRDFPGSIEHDTLMAKRLKQRNRFTVPEFSLLPLIVSTSDMISLVPKSMALRFQSIYEIEIFEPPIAFPALSLNLLWSRGREKDPRFEWFLDMIRSSFGKLSAEAEAAAGGRRST